MPRKHTAFTLVELLVVIAIISILLMVTASSLRGARACAQRVVSAGNMRQLGIAIHLYAENNHGNFPKSSHDGSKNQSWIYTLGPYLGDIDKIRICPADPKRAERLENNGTSYVLNEYICVVQRNPFGVPTVPDFTKMQNLKSPACTITAFVGADGLNTNETADHTHSMSWFTGNAEPWRLICTDIQPDRYRARTQAPDKNIGSSNYLYADTRVETIKAELIRQKAENFENFAQPPH